jgi:hypothetical protein
MEVEVQVGKDVVELKMQRRLPWRSLARACVDLPASPQRMNGAGSPWLVIVFLGLVGVAWFGWMADSGRRCWPV